MSLTVCGLFVRGEYPYTVEYVRRLHGMVLRWSDRPFRFCCLTDQPDVMPAGVDVIPVQRFPNCFAYWTKLELFNPAHAFTGRMLFLDLDTLVVAPLAPIIDYPAPFAVTADPVLPGRHARAQDRHGRRIIRRVNSSVMVWDAGERSELYRAWTPSVAQVLSGDQDWIAECAPDVAMMPRSWFPRLSEVQVPPFGEAKVILSKFPKNHVAMREHEWFGAYWGAA